MTTASDRQRARTDLDLRLVNLDTSLAATESQVEAGRLQLIGAGDRFTAENWQTARSHLLTAIAHLDIARKFLA